MKLVRRVRRLSAADPKVVGAQPVNIATDQAPLVRFVLDFLYNKLYNESIAYPQQIKCCISTASTLQVHNVPKNRTINGSENPQ